MAEKGFKRKLAAILNTYVIGHNGMIKLLKL